MALLAGASTASAAKRWTGPKVISGGDEVVDFPEVAINGRGKAVAVWYGGTESELTMRSATRLPGGKFQDPVTVGAANEPTGDNPPSLPSVAIDRRGNAIASWLRTDAEGNLRVVVAFQPPNGEFGPPVDLSDPGQPAFDPQVAFDRRGRAVAVWERFDGTSTRAQIAYKGANASGFGAAQTLSPPGRPADVPRVGLTEDGTAYVVWLSQELTPPFVHEVQSRLRMRNGDLTELQVLSRVGEDGDDPRIAVSRKGTAMATWTQGTQTSPDVVATAFAAAPDDQPFQDPVTLPTEPGLAGLLGRPAVDRRGRTTILWLQAPPEDEPGTRFIVATPATRSGAIGSGQLLDRSTDDLLQPAIGVAAAGNAVAAWSNVPMNPPNTVRVAARGGRAQQFEATQTLNPVQTSGGTPAVATNRKLGVAVWELTTGDLGSGVVANLYRR